MCWPLLRCPSYPGSEPSWFVACSRPSWLPMTSLGFSVLRWLTLSPSPAVALAPNPAASVVLPSAPLGQPSQGCSWVPTQGLPLPPSLPWLCPHAGLLEALRLFHPSPSLPGLSTPHGGSSTETVLLCLPSWPCSPLLFWNFGPAPRLCQGHCVPYFPCISCSWGPSSLGGGGRDPRLSAFGGTELVAPGGPSWLPCTAPVSRDGAWHRVWPCCIHCLACSAERQQWRAGPPGHFHFNSSPTTWPGGGTGPRPGMRGSPL